MDSVKVRPAPMTHEEIAKKLGISKQRVGQILERAHRKLRKHPVMKRLAQECGFLKEED